MNQKYTPEVLVKLKTAVKARKPIFELVKIADTTPSSLVTTLQKLRRRKPNFWLTQADSLYLSHEYYQLQSAGFERPVGIPHRLRKHVSSTERYKLDKNMLGIVTLILDKRREVPIQELRRIIAEVYGVGYSEKHILSCMTEANPRTSENEETWIVHNNGKLSISQNEKALEKFSDFVYFIYDCQGDIVPGTSYKVNREVLRSLVDYLDNNRRRK